MIIGHEIDLSSYPDLEVFRDFNGKDDLVPSRVVLKTESYELTILNKKIYE